MTNEVVVSKRFVYVCIRQSCLNSSVSGNFVTKVGFFLNNKKNGEAKKPKNGHVLRQIQIDLEIYSFKLKPLLTKVLTTFNYTLSY